MKTLYPSSDEIHDLMRRIRKTRIGVLGDFCLDGYWWIDGKENEISIETGKPVRRVKRQRYTLGGAGNVVVNLRALGVEQVFAFGVTGPDPFGRELVQMLGKIGSDTEGMLIQAKGWDTPVYGKPILNEEELERMDFGGLNRMDDLTWQELCERLHKARQSLDFIVINQQHTNGWCTEKRAAELADELFTHWPGRHLVDVRQFGSIFRRVSRKMNEREASDLTGRSLGKEIMLSDKEAQELGDHLAKNSENIQFITRGAQGILVCKRDSCHSIPGILVLGPTDPVGAGDTVTAVLAACLSAGIHHVEAACLANLAASITIQKLKQTGTATEEELVRAAGQVAYVYHPTLADEVRMASRREETDIEIVESLHGGMISCAIFDHDGTISTLRQGWETIMEPVMIKSILGKSYATADSSIFQRVRGRVHAFIEQSTGIQTLVQMDALVEMVTEFGFVPEMERLDAIGYKQVYNNALMAMVSDRIARLKRGELESPDFIIKGAVDFLKALSKAGVELYLASGTDQEDVVREAASLGYGSLFGDRIRGATCGSRTCSKEEVIESILRQPSYPEQNLLVVGDGPVEIRQARRHMGVALGVASHEERRFGLNEAKRRRLIRAGAHLIVPDFSQWPLLIQLLLQAQK
jgi:rfaE bifunctional protein kinase chain/domain